MTLSTLSTSKPLWIVFMAMLACLIASNVSLLIFAVSMLYIWRSSVMICAAVCSSDCSNCFFRRSAVLAATGYQFLARWVKAALRQQGLTGLVGRDIFPRERILLVRLILQMRLPLVEHLQLGAQLQNSLLGRILLLLGPSSKPAEAPARHCCKINDEFDV